MKNPLIKANQARQPQLQYAESLYFEAYYKLFKISQFEAFNDKSDYLFYSFHKVLTTLLTDLFLAGGLDISVQNETQNGLLSDTLSDTKLIAKVYSLATNASIYGDGIAQIVVQDGKVLDIIIHETKDWEPIPNPLGEAYPPVGHAILRNIEKENKKVYTLVESHYPGKIVFTAYSGDSQVELFPLFERELMGLAFTPALSSLLEMVLKTEYEFPLIFQFKNIETFTSLYGQSDYNSGSVSKVKKINEILNQRQYVIRMHGNPKMVVPRALISQTIRQLESEKEVEGIASDFNFESRSQARLAVNREKTATETYIAQELVRKMEFLPDDSIDGTSQYRYVEYNGKLDESEKQLNLLRDLLYEESSMPKIMLTQEVSMGNLSGVAIKRLSANALNRVKQKKESFTSTLKHLIYTILQIQGASSPEYPTIKFGDSIPDSLTEKIDSYQKMLDSSIVSQKKAIEDVLSLSPQESEAMQSEIRGETDLFSGNTLTTATSPQN